jgi:hypothetical protein
MDSHHKKKHINANVVVPELGIPFGILAACGQIARIMT